MEKFYGIETTEPDYYGSCRHRFHSLYNGARGSWEYDIEKAKKQGEKHQEIIRMMWRESSTCRGIPNS